MSKSTEIKAINTETVHRICSGQVVLGLNIAVKELVENAIDAGATNIDIRLKTYGQDTIEVSDNGLGVQECNFAALTLKHYTSKITEFSDLENVQTLGFRGEALSSLCALADLTITTRHESSEHATILQYDHMGNIVSQKITARSVGTTVQLSNLFAVLPVRRKEFTKNSRKEFNKMCSLLYAYCLLCAGIKFTCTNQVLNNKNIIVSTTGTGSITDNIVTIFGKKQAPNLINVALVSPNEAIATDYAVRTVPEEVMFEFDFYISSAIHGSGRSAADRQFYYINSRPCEPQKLAKLVNETYRSFNTNQYPFVYLNIKVLHSLVDVNVTPDKRQIFLEQEKLLMATVKMSLLEAFKDTPSTFKMHNLNLSGQITHIENDSKRKYEQVDDKANVKSFLESFKKRKRGDIANCSRQINEDVIKCPVTPKRVQKSLVEYSLVKKNIDCVEGSTISPSAEISITQLEKIEETSILVHELLNFDDKSPDKSFNVAGSNTPEHIDQSSSIKREELKKIVYDAPSKQDTKKDVPFVTLNFTLDSIRQAVEENERTKNVKRELVVKFRAEIAPQSNKDAEQELQKQFSKSMFKEMRVIGQFNYGFIIAALNSDLFIVDQHASDEKYNFEMLQQNTIMDSQILVNPKSLQLTSVDAAILMENEKLFNKNGFYFEHNPQAEVTERIKLTKIPMSKSTIFGKDDIDEMIYMLKEGADSNCRPSRIRGMFASRACRKSVMVGKALNRIAMKRLIDHMGEIEQPWNCPHGRPTMRHLINMNLLDSF